MTAKAVEGATVADQAAAKRLSSTFSFLEPMAVAQVQSIELSTEEQTFLSENKTFTLCVDPNFMPFEQINAKGQHEGLFADFLDC